MDPQTIEFAAELRRHIRANVKRRRETKALLDRLAYMQECDPCAETDSEPCAWYNDSRAALDSALDDLHEANERMVRLWEEMTGRGYPSPHEIL